MISRYLVPAGILLCLSQSVIASELTASLSWSGLRQLSLPLTGVVKEVMVAAGETAPKGHKLLSLDCGKQQARLDEVKNIADGLTPGVEKALKDKKLADELFDRTVLSEVEHREAELIYIEKKSRFGAAQAVVKQVQWELQHCFLVADRKLMVLDIHYAIGELFNLETADKGLITVADADELLLVAELDQPLQAKSKPGSVIKASINGKTYSAVIKQLRYSSNGQWRLEAVVKTSAAELIGSKDAKLVLP